MTASSLIVVLALATGALADTCYDGWGNRYHCNHLSNAARIGIGIAVAVAALIFSIMLAFYYRRRRLARNAQFATYQQSQPAPHTGAGGWNNGATGYGAGSGAGTYGNGPKYPPQTHQDPYGAPQGPPPGQNGYPGGFVAPGTGPARDVEAGDGSMPPPQYTAGQQHYAPPTGPPPPTQ